MRRGKEIKMGDDFKALHALVEETQNNICQIAVIKNGRLAYEDYWHGFKSTDTLHVMSATKSVVSVLMGIALDRELVESVHQPVLDFFPNYRIKRGEKTIQSVTIEHLLTMTAPYKYKSEPWTKICSSENWTNATLDVLGGRAGLTGEFRYSTLGIHILTAILAQVSGMNTVDFAHMGYGYLWWTPERGKSAYAALGNSGNVIYIDPAANTVTAVTGTFKPSVLDRVQFIQKNISPLFDE